MKAMIFAAGLGIQSEVELDLTLARGLNYYTGAIFEVKALAVVSGVLPKELYPVIRPFFSTWYHGGFIGSLDKVGLTG